MTPQVLFIGYVHMASPEVAPGRGLGPTLERARTKCDYCRKRKCKVSHEGALTVEGMILCPLELILRSTKCYPSDRVWSNGEKCFPCEKGGLPCGPNVSFSGSSLPHGPGRGLRSSPTATTTQHKPPHHRTSTAHNRDVDVLSVSAGSSAGLNTTSVAEAILESPAPTSANGKSKDSCSSSERCEVLI